MLDKAQKSRRARRAQIDALRWSIPLILVTAGIYAFYNSFFGPFVLDDLYSIQFNRQIRTLWPPWNALSPPKNCAVAGRPVVNFSLALNYAFGGLNVAGYHLFNLALHILSALTLFGVLRRTLSRADTLARYRAQSTGLALVVALVWMVHPLQTESVTYTIQRTELMMGLFFLLTLYCFIRSLDSRRKSDWQVAAIIACALGMGSKEVMVVSPLIVLLYDRMFVCTSFREMWRRRQAFYGGLAATWLILAGLVASGPRTRAVGFGFEDLTAWKYLLTQSEVIVHYLRLSLWPHPLVFDYDGWPVAERIADVFPSLLFLLVLLGATVIALYRGWAVGFVGACFFLILAPTSSIVPISTEIAAERRMYLPLVSLIVLFVFVGDAAVRWLCGRLRAELRFRRQVTTALVVGAVGVLGYFSAQRNEDYESVISIWTDAVTKRPNNPRGQMNLGHFLAEEGRIQEAGHHYAEAVKADPGNALAHYGLGVVLARQGKREEAIDSYRRALLLDPHYASAHYNLGLLLAEQGRLEEAIGHEETAVSLKPGWQQPARALKSFRARAERNNTLTR